MGERNKILSYQILLKTKKMKKHIILNSGAMLLMAASVFSSCESDVLDLVPVNAFSDATAYSSAARCELSMIGAYDAAQCGLYNNSTSSGWTRGYPFGSAHIMQGEMRGEDMNLTAVFYQITYEGTYTPSSANNLTMWTASFEAINRFNVVMEGEVKAGEDGIITAEQANSYKGECLFLRALTYHNLMVHFAYPYNMTGVNNDMGLPIYTTAHTTTQSLVEGMETGRSSVKDTYAQILKDLDEAESLLPATQPANQITRATKGAAIALKTRVYLHMRDWNNVINESKKLVSSVSNPTSAIGGYLLEGDPSTPFTACMNNKESIFSIENSGSDNASVNGAMWSMFSGRVEDGSRAMCPTSPILYNTEYWLANDKRRTELLHYDLGNAAWFCDKYRDGTRADYSPIIRYAEVILNYAEAAYRSGDKATALALLNDVRNRSLADPATEAYTLDQLASDKDFMTALLWERRIEFHGEGLRWLDIHRLAQDDIIPSEGIPAKIGYANYSKLSQADQSSVWSIGKAMDPAWYVVKDLIPCTDYRFVWPIPTPELTNNPTLAAQQNTGW